MKILVNGEEKNFNDNLSVENLIISLGVEGKVMAVAINSHIVKKDDWGLRILQDGDKIELLQFTGGG